MSYRFIKYYRHYPLEVREFGETGWAVHVYAPPDSRSPGKVAVVTTAKPSGLQDVLDKAHQAVDRDIAGATAGETVQA